MRATLFTDDIHFMAPEGTREEIHAVAREAGQSASEFLRAAVRGCLAEVQADSNGAGDE